MGDIFDSVAAQPAAQPAAQTQQPPVSAPTSAAPARSGDIFDSVAAEHSASSSNTGPHVPSSGEVLTDVLGGGPSNPLNTNAVNTALSQGMSGAIKSGGETAHTLGAVAGKLMPNSWRDALGLPSSFKQPDYLQSTSGAEIAGKVADNIAEFALSDEALKGLALAKRLGIAQKLHSMAESSPYIAKILEHGLTAIRGGAATVPQQMAHGATPTEALKTGAEAGVAGMATGAAVEGASALANTEAGQAVRNIVKGGQPRLQTAVREAAQAGSDVASARPTVEAPVDKYPVSVEHDASGNVVNADGRHRVVEAWQRGDSTIPVTTKLADGTTEVINQTPQAAAKKMGIGNTLDEAKATLAKTDATQPYRVGNGASRPPVFEAAAPKPSPDMTPVKPTSGIRNTLQNVSNDVQAKGKSIYSQLDTASGGRFQRYKDTLGKIDDQLDNLVEGVDDDRISALEQKKAEVETSQNQMFEDLKLTKGLDPEAVKVADAHWKQSMALHDISRDVRMSTTGDITSGATKTEDINPKMLANRLQKRFDSGRLQQALGDEGAQALLKEAYAAKTTQAVRRVVAGLGALAVAYSGYAHHMGIARAAAEAAAIP